MALFKTGSPRSNCNKTSWLFIYDRVINAKKYKKKPDSLQKDLN